MPRGASMLEFRVRKMGMGVYEACVPEGYLGSILKHNPYHDELGRFADAPEDGSPLAQHLGKASPKMEAGLSLDEVYRRAEQDVEPFRAMLEAVATATGGEIFTPFGLMKPRASAEQKIGRGKQPHELSDVVRGSVQYDTVSEAYSGAKALLRDYGERVLQVDDKFANPTPLGYRDISMKVQNPNGSIGELLLTTRAITAVKEGEGHKLYEHLREIQHRMVQEGRKEATEAETVRIEAIAERSRELYSRAAGRST